MTHRLARYDPEFETFDGEVDRSDQEFAEGQRELDEMGLAARLLDMSSEAELGSFLQRLILHVERSLRTRVPPARRQAVAGLLARAIRRAAPRFATSSGGAFGRTFGGRLSSLDSRALGLQLEGLSAEDAEFETARQLVRFAVDAVTKAADPSTPNPHQAARDGLVASARRHAPGFVRLLALPESVPGAPIGPRRRRLGDGGLTRRPLERRTASISHP